MDSFLDFSSTALVQPLLIAAVVSVAALTVLGARGPHLARIGLRHARRRRARTALIVAGLMLSTTFIAAALAVDDTISLAVKTIAVFNLGRIDEDVLGGSGALHLYPDYIGVRVAQRLAEQPHVAGVAPALVVQNVLVADETARQVHGGIISFALAPDSAGPLGSLRTTAGTPAPVAALSPTGIYLNASTAQTLNARVGDTIYLYSTLWPGHRYRFQAQAIVAGGPLGDPPAIVLPLARLQSMANAGGSINHIFVANAGDGLTGVGYTEEIEDQIYTALPRGLHVHVAEVKQDGVRFALRAQDIFGRILALFTLFALAIGLLLIFLIFVLLAAERRAELGMLRALGMRRAHVVRMLLFEGGVYDGLAALAGMLAGLGLGVVIVLLVSPTIARIGFPLKIAVQPQSLIVAFCLGLLITLVTIWLAAWTVSRMTVAAALRDLPEPPPMRLSLFSLLWLALRSTAQAFTPHRAQSEASDQEIKPTTISVSLRSLRALRFPRSPLTAWGAVAWALIARGPVPLILGWALLRRGITTADELLFSLGLSLAALGLALLIRSLALSTLVLLLRLRRHPDPVRVLGRATVLLDRLTTLLTGAALALYWSLPFDALDGLGFARFGGGIQTFFVASVMMVFGAVWALAPNLDLLLLPVGSLLTRLGRLRHVARISLVYPAQHRFRTGIGLSLFSLVCFTMVVMACIAASATHSYDNVPQQASGYDIAGQPLFQPIGDVSHMRAALTQNGAAAHIATISAATPLPLGIIQPGAPRARWQVYPVSTIQGAFLDGAGLPLIARASGLTSDAAVWRAVRDHPGNVVIDAGALSDQDAAALGIQLPPAVTLQQFIGPPIAAGLPGLSSLDAVDGRTAAGRRAGNGLLPQFIAAAQDQGVFDTLVLHLAPIVTAPGTIAPTPIWVADLRGGATARLTIVGIVQNVSGQRTGLFGSPATFAPVESGLPPFGNDYYYFQVRPGADARATALQIGSALMDYGFETTVLQDVLLDVNGPRVFISRVLVGLVGLTLLVGMAALAVTGSRAVVERRQQIGMLRALGFHRLHVQLGFLIESLLVGAAGTAIGLILGLILCRNVFAVDFFEPFQSGLTLVIPWRELAVICAASLAAATIASLLPAWQAGRVAPADALRYE